MKKTRKEMHRKNYFDPYRKLNFSFYLELMIIKLFLEIYTFKNIKNIIILNNKFN